MPLFFTLLGYGVVYLASLPFINTFASVGNLIIGSSVPEFNSELDSIFNNTPVAPDIEDPPSIDTISISEITVPKNGTHYAQISCTRIGLDAPLYMGDSNQVLNNGIGQYAGSSLPGFGLPLLLAGHNNTYFLPLQYVEVGDIFTITTNYGIYEYEITEARVAYKGDTSAYDLSQTKEQLIMYTCHPFGILGNMGDRYFVYGSRISGPVVAFD